MTRAPKRITARKAAGTEGGSPRTKHHNVV